MTLLKHELKAGFVSLLIWSGVVAAMTMLTMLMYPAFRGQMDMVSSVFAMMGSFSAAFGMDVLAIGTAVGFYGIESGTMLAVGGTMFAAVTGIAMLSKEEGGHTAEFLLTQPISRVRVVLEKLLALILLLAGFNALCALTGALCFLLIGETLPVQRFLMFHLLQLMLHGEIGCICFGLSAAARRPQVGLGLGIALLLYFMSLLVNMIDTVAFLRFVTPFCYADAASVLARGTTDGLLIAIGALVTVFFAGLALLWYDRKDLAA